MNHFKNEFRKNYNLVFYIVYLTFLILTILSVNAVIGFFSENTSALSFSYICSARFMSILIIMCIINIINIFTVDYKHNTWKNLLCTGTHKNVIQLSKVALSFVSSIVLLLATYLISFIIGVILYKFNPNEQISSEVSVFDFSNENLTSSAIAIFSKSLINNLVLIIFFITFVMLVAELFRGSKHVTLITIILYFASSFIKTIIDIYLILKPEYKALKLLPFVHLDPNSRAFTTPEMIMSNCVLLTYAIIFFAIALLLFKKREIATSK